LGKVPIAYNAQTGEVTYQFPYRLRDRECRVWVRFRRAGESEDDLISWAFFVDRLPYYLEDAEEGGGEQAGADGRGAAGELVAGGN
jgi:hypothetical protein